MQNKDSQLIFEAYLKAHIKDDNLTQKLTEMRDYDIQCIIVTTVRLRRL